MSTLPHSQIAIVKFLAPTETLGARVKITDGTTGYSHTIPYRYECNNAEHVAVTWLRENGISPIGRASLGSRNTGECILIHDPKDSRLVFWLFVPVGEMATVAIN
jgi:hypothetical protein